MFFPSIPSPISVLCQDIVPASPADHHCFVLSFISLIAFVMNAVQLAQYYNGDHEPATAAPSPKLSFVGTAFSDSLRLPIPTPRSWQPSPRLWRSLWRRWKPRLSRRKSTAKIAPRAVKDDPDEEPGIIEISAGLGSPNKADGDLEMLPTFPAGDEDSTRGQQWGAKLLMIYSGEVMARVGIDGS